MKREINDILDECVEAIIHNEKAVSECLDAHAEMRAELEPLLMTALSLIEVPRMSPDDARKRAAKERLLAAVEQRAWEAGVERKPARTGKQASGKARVPLWRRPAMRLGVITLVFAMLSGGTMVMAKESLPGSPLYPVKLAVEKAKVGMASDDEKKAKLYLSYAERRIDEMRALDAGDGNNPALVKSIARNIGAAEAAAGENTGVESALDDFVKRNKVVLRAVLDKAPESAKPAIERALNRDKEVDADDERKDDVKAGDDKKDSRDGKKLDRESDELDEGRKTPESEQPRTEKPKDSKGSSADDDDGVNSSSNDGRRKSSTTGAIKTTAPQKKERVKSYDPGAKNGDNDDDEEERDGDDADRKNTGTKVKRVSSCMTCKSPEPIKND